MERIGLDVYHVGSRKFLAMVDFYSSFILVKEMKRTTNENIFKTLDAWFSIFSSPQFCRCDGGEFRDAFDRFLGQRGIIREQGSAYQSQSQGLIFPTNSYWNYFPPIRKGLLQFLCARWVAFVIWLGQILLAFVIFKTD